MTDSPENLQRRCPRLGGAVSFLYCRTCSEDGGPCWKVFDCWWETFDVTAYLRANMPAEPFGRLCRARPKPKVASILELVERARQQTAGHDN